MNPADLSPGAIEHAYPVAQVILLFLGGIVTIVGGFWAGFRWLQGVINKEFVTLIAAFQDSSDRRHETHERDIKELKQVAQETKSAIKRLHDRVDNAIKRGPP